MIEIGDWVRLKTLPPWVAELPEETQEVFRFCVGRRYQVSDIDQHGHFVLDVSDDIDERFGGYMNVILVEAEYLELSEGKET